MTGGAAELQGAIFSLLTGDATLIALLGGAKVFDHAPANAQFPYVSLGRMSSFDWSTATEGGCEHLLTIHAWSKGRGKKEVLALMDRARFLLDEAPLTLAGHTLVALRLEGTDARYDEDAGAYHGLLRLRAVTEPT